MSANLAGPIELFKRTIKTLIDRILVFIGIYLLAIGFQLLASFLGLGALFLSLFGLDSFRSPAIFGNLKSFWLILVLVIIYGLVTILVHFWSQIGLLMVIKHQVKKIGVFEAYRLGWKKLFPYFGSVLLMTVAIFGGLVVFVIPGLILSIWLAFVPMVVVFDNFGGLKAMIVSREYVRGRFWSVIWRLISFGLLIMFLSIIFSQLRTEIMFDIGIGYFASALSFLLNSLTVPLSMIYFTHLFLSLKESKPEVGLDLKKRTRFIYLFFIALGLAAILVLPTWLIRFIGQSQFL